MNNSPSVIDLLLDLGAESVQLAQVEGSEVLVVAKVGKGVVNIDDCDE